MQMSEVPDGVKTMVKNFQETEENLGNREVRLRKALYGYMTSSNCSTTGHTNTSETIGGTLRRFFFTTIGRTSVMAASTWYNDAISILSRGMEQRYRWQTERAWIPPV
jgi:hypothetical protein